MTERPNISLVNIFRDGIISNRKGISSKLRRTAQALQWRQSFQNTSSCEISIANTPINIVQVPNPEELGIGTGGQVWPAAVVLCKYLEKKFGGTGLAGKEIIELGSGTGILGIVCAVLGCKSVTITDQVTTFPLIAKNCKKILESSATPETASSVNSSSTSSLIHHSEESISLVYSPDTISDNSSTTNTDDISEVYIKTYDWGAPTAGLTMRPERSRTYTHNKRLDSMIELDLILVSDCILPKLYPIEPLVQVGGGDVSYLLITIYVDTRMHIC